MIYIDKKPVFTSLDQLIIYVIFFPLIIAIVYITMAILYLITVTLYA